MKQAEGRIVSVTFRTVGCKWSNGIEMALKRHAEGKTTLEACYIIESDVERELGGVPRDKIQFLPLAIRALRGALYVSFSEASMVTLSKPAEGNTGWATAVNQNWTDIESAINSGTTLAMLDPGVNKVSRTTTCSWTDLDISSDTGANTAKYAIFQVTIDIYTYSSGTTGNILAQFRKKGSSSSTSDVLPMCDSIIGRQDDLRSKITTTVIVELDIDEKCQYCVQQLVTPQSFTLKINLIGYFK